jgi:hypothetical protein
MCDHAVMPRVPLSPVTTAYVLFKAWRRLPPRHRRVLLTIVREHGPAVAAMAVSASRRKMQQRRAGA